MANREKNQKLNEWLKQTQQSRPKQTASRPQPTKRIVRPSRNDNSLDKINKLKRELRNAKNAAANAEKSRDQVVNAREANKEDKGMHSVLHEFSERFDKTYHPHYVDENGKETTYPLHIIMKPLTMADQYEVYAQEEELTHNMGRFFEANEHVVLQAFTTMRVAGIQVPKAFKDPTKLYRMNLLIQVYFDYLDWERKFCSHRKD